MTLSTKIEVFTDFTFVRSGPSYMHCCRAFPLRQLGFLVITRTLYEVIYQLLFVFDCELLVIVVFFLLIDVLIFICFSQLLINEQTRMYMFLCFIFSVRFKTFSVLFSLFARLNWQLACQFSVFQCKPFIVSYVGPNHAQYRASLLFVFEFSPNLQNGD